MKKVGIVTFYGVNYGSALQVYALQKKVQELGYKVSVIDYKNTKKYYGKIVRVMTLLNRYIGMKRAGISTELTKSKAQYSCRTAEIFEEFYSRYIEFSDDNYLNPQKYDAFIAGSDQIWGINIPGLHYVYYLRFTSKKKRIAYAPSFGGNEVPKYNTKKLATYLKGMRHISVREKSGVDIVDYSINKHVLQVVDPTLLVGRTFWDDLLSNIETDKVGIFCYFLDDTSLGYNVIEQLKKDSKFDVWWTEIGTKCNNPSYVQKNLSPFEFVNAIRNAKYVVTDSYHAMLFSILFSKDFYVVERNYQRNNSQADRIISMLELLKIENRYIKNLEDVSMALDGKMYDTEQVDKIISEKRRESEQYLKMSLANVCK